MTCIERATRSKLIMVQFCNSTPELRVKIRPRHQLMPMFLGKLDCIPGYNSRFFHNFSQEDTLGILKPVCIKSNSHSKGFEPRVLRRAMLRCLFRKILDEY